MTAKISALVYCDVCGKAGAEASVTSRPLKYLASALVTAARQDLHESGWVTGVYQVGGRPVDICPVCRLIAPASRPCDNDGANIEDVTP